MTYKIIKVYILNYNTKLEVYFYFCIDYFLYNLFKTSWYLVLLLYFNFNKEFKAFSKIKNYN